MIEVHAILIVRSVPFSILSAFLCEILSVLCGFQMLSAINRGEETEGCAESAEEN
jgi:hypothetical protein